MAYKNNSEIDAKCQATIESSYPLFVIHTNHVTTLPDTPLYALCERIYFTALRNLSLDPFVPLHAILTATFDHAHRAFILPDTPSTLLATLSADARACIFAQAVAGIVSFLRGIAAHPGLLTADGAAAKLRRFADGDERVRMLQAVEAWAGWGDCFEKAQIGVMIMDVVGIEAGDIEVGKKAGNVSVVEVDEFAEAPALYHDGPHLRREFGVPDQFRIMVLN